MRSMDDWDDWPDDESETEASERTITQLTRRNLFDGLRMKSTAWSGRLEEPEFLARLYDLSAMRSFDSRFKDASGDIYQHRINNEDWDDDWVYGDRRFSLMTCPDEELLNFLCEMVHPVVRSDAAEVRELVTMFNEHLGVDGWELYEATYLSGHPVFAGRRRGAALRRAIDKVQGLADAVGGTEYITQQITRMNAAAESDAALAVGTAKELVETVCKTILEARSVAVDTGWGVPQLVRATAKELSLTPDDIPDSAKGSASIRRLLMNLASVATALAEVRNLYGTGHGKGANTKGLQARHAHLAIGAAATLVTFLWETHVDRAESVQPTAGP